MCAVYTHVTPIL